MEEGRIEGSQKPNPRETLHKILGNCDNFWSPIAPIISLKSDPHVTTISKVIKKAHDNIDDLKKNKIPILEEITSVECLGAFLKGISPDFWVSIEKKAKELGITGTEYLNVMFYEWENKRSAEEIRARPDVVAISNIPISVNGITITIERDRKTAREKSGSGSFPVKADFCYNLFLQDSSVENNIQRKSGTKLPGNTINNIIGKISEILPNLSRRLDEEAEIDYSAEVAYKLAEPYLERIRLVNEEIIAIEMRVEGELRMEGKEPANEGAAAIFTQKKLRMNEILRDLFEHFVFIQQGTWLPIGLEDHDRSLFAFTPDRIAGMLVAKVLPKAIVNNKRDSKGNIIPISDAEKLELTKETLKAWSQFAGLFNSFSLSHAQQNDPQDEKYFDDLVKKAQEEPKSISQTQEEYFENILKRLRQKKDPPESEGQDSI